MKNEPKALLSSIISSDADKSKEFAQRRRASLTKTISSSKVNDYLDHGWTIVKKLKKGTQIRFDKSFSEIVENKLWCLLYKMGFSELNKGNEFEIFFKTAEGEIASKHINVFAKDDDTIIVAECKSCEKLTRISLLDDLVTLSNIKRRLVNSIKKFYEEEFNHKIIWIFFTSNIIWSKADVTKANELKIKVITEKEYEYLNQIVVHLGVAARYQFLAEYCCGEDIPNLRNRSIPAIKGRLGGRFFYSFVTTPDHLLKIAFVNHRALDDPRGIPAYQRLVKKERIKEIENFIRNGGYFPTNILINFSHNLEFKKISKGDDGAIEYGLLNLPPKYKTAWIIDGQHRLYGFANLPPEERKQNIFVLAFERLPKEKEAELFVTINHEQKSVSRTLLDDLEGDLKWGASKPNERIGAICARLIKNINTEIGGFFYDRFIAQGIKASDKNSLTIPWIKNGLKDSGLLGRATDQNKTYAPGVLSGSDDVETLNNAHSFLEDFFGEIVGANPARWEMGRTGYLCTNAGIFGYLLLASALAKHCGLNKYPCKLNTNQFIDKIYEYMDPVLCFVASASDEQFSSKFKVPYGASGPKQYYWQLCKIINSVYHNFSPEGFTNWNEAQSYEKVANADSQVKFIQSSVAEYIFKKLKAVYQNNEKYLMLSVDTKTYTKAVEKQTQSIKEGKDYPIEVFFDFSDVIEIVTSKNNWKYFQDVFAIPRKSNNKKDQTAWMIRVNQLRRNHAHPSPDRSYSVDDFDFLDEFVEVLEQNYERVGFSPTQQYNSDRR